jgi:hypothetical protein
MKKCIILPLLVGLIIVLFSCESMEGMLEQATENVVKDSVSTTTKTVGVTERGPSISKRESCSSPMRVQAGTAPITWWPKF